MKKHIFTDRICMLLNSVTDMHGKIRNVDKSIEKLYPIAVVKENVFYIFDIIERKYTFIKTGEIPGIQIPKGVLAAFPLPFYDGRGCVVVDESALETTEGLIFVFHEFVHCYQLETSENKLKTGLEIHRKALGNGNSMWELSHPFPYDNLAVSKLLDSLYESLIGQSIDGIKGILKELKTVLSNVDCEYMLWQEWKEGYARYIENKLRAVYKLKINSGSITGVKDRVIFYELGNIMILVY